VTRKRVWIFNAAKHSFMSNGAQSFVPYGGVDGLNPEEYPHVAVCNFHEPDEILAAARWMISEHDITAIVAPHEKYLMLAAQLRTEFDLPGLQRENAILFRDKLKMKQALQAAGVRVPEFAILDSIQDLEGQDWSTGSKIIKSRFGVGGADVYHVDRLETARDAWRTAGPGAGQFEIEEFIHGPMYHVDAVIVHDKVIFTSASRYLAKPADFSPGGIFGSVGLRQGELLERIIEFNARALAALGMDLGVTHLELFHTPEDELVFCEVAARPGGAGVDRAIDLCFGINMIEAAIRLESGLDLRIPERAFDRVGGPVWGFVGTYPMGEERRPAIAPEYHAALGIVEYQQGQAGPRPRHCSDFDHRYIVKAADESAFERQYQALLDASANTTAIAAPAANTTEFRCFGLREAL
jgi:hypothetical protein